MKRNRVEWIESLKLLAALLVFTTHFLAEFEPDWLAPWREGHILYGVSGKLAVSLFFVMAGFFAMKVKKENAWQYIAKRYFRFMIPVLLIEIVVFCMMAGFKVIEVDAWLPANMTGKYISAYHTEYRMFLWDIFLLDGKVILTYWCNIMLFLGPVMVTLLHGLYEGKGTKTRNASWIRAAIFFGIPAFIALLMGYVWYSICMIGAVLYLLVQNEREVFKKWGTRIGLAAVLYFCIRTPETNVGYLCKGVASACLLLLVFYSKKMQAMLENRFCKALSKYSFEIYLLHMPVNLMIISFMFGFLENMGINRAAILLITYVLSIALTVLFSIGIQSMSAKILKVLFEETERKDIPV